MKSNMTDQILSKLCLIYRGNNSYNTLIIFKILKKLYNFTPTNLAIV